MPLPKAFVKHQMHLPETSAVRRRPYILIYHRYINIFIHINNNIYIKGSSPLRYHLCKIYT